MTDLNLDLNQSLDLRVAQFKNDPEKMAEVSDFLNEVFDKAQKEAELRRNEKSSKGKLDALGLQSKFSVLTDIGMER
ncbi:hypothetical protein YQE_11913, partial [Dendroctonus ponderosae]